jgi:hypothetical protein
MFCVKLCLSTAIFAYFVGRDKVEGGFLLNGALIYKTYVALVADEWHISMED